MSLSSKKATNQFAEHLFRNFYKEVFSSLVLKFGNNHIYLIEDALQETFYKALKSWKIDKYPKNAKGWLFTVTKNYIINELKRVSKTESVSDFINTDYESFKNNEDAQLKLLLVSSKFNLKNKAKLIFTLKSICGFGVGEIANGLLISEENIYKQHQRVKKKLQAIPKEQFFNITNTKLVATEINYLEEIIYFMFNEGYDSVAKSSEQLINKDICYEALRLAHLLEDRYKLQSTKHLLSLFYFHIARFDSRFDEDGNFISLIHQDRKKWNKQYISLAFKYLEKPDVLHRYYLESLIASIHISATTFKDTNWQQILNIYTILLKLVNTPVVRLNRAICLMQLGKKTEAIKELDAIKEKLQDSYFYYSVIMAEYLASDDEKLYDYWYNKSLEKVKQPIREKMIRAKFIT